MKQLFSFVSAILVAGTMCAQAITIDGDNTDWAEVPMLTEPGVEPIAKMIVPQKGVTLPEDAAFALMVQGDHELMKAYAPVIYVDADKDKTTGTPSWWCLDMGYDYEMTIWMDGLSTHITNESGTLHEMSVQKSAFTGIPYNGSLWAVIGFNWGAYNIPADPITDGYKWNENLYHPFHIAPHNAYVFIDMERTNKVANAFSTHQALKPAETLQLSTDATGNDTAYWVSWAVELKNPANYYVSVDFTATNTTSADLYLVDPATNTIVSTFVGEDIWAPQGETAYGTWDLSTVPAGKYMLKLKNHVQWSNVSFKSVTFSTEKPSTALENTLVETTSKKVVENGQIYVIRGNERYNVLGTSVR